MQEILCKQSLESLSMQKVVIFSCRAQLCNNTQNAFHFAVRQPEEFFIYFYNIKNYNLKFTYNDK